MGILDTVKTVNDFEDRFKGIIYGHQGSGKTQFASDFPSPLWFDFENSTETLRNIGKGNIPTERPKNMKRFEDIAMEAVKDTSPYETIVVDTANSLQVFQMLEHMMVAASKNSSRDIDLPYQADYRKSTAQLTRIFAAMHHSNKHIVVLCQERIYTERDETSGKERVVAIRPDLTKRLADAIEQMLNVVGYLEKKSGATPTSPVKRTMYLNPSGKIFAKNRLGIEAITIENPTYTNIYQNKGKTS